MRVQVGVGFELRIMGGMAPMPFKVAFGKRSVLKLGFADRTRCWVCVYSDMFIILVVSTDR